MGGSFPAFESFSGRRGGPVGPAELISLQSRTRPGQLEETPVNSHNSDQRRAVRNCENALQASHFEKKMDLTRVF